MPVTRMIGIDPGLQRTGWGLIESDGARLSHIAHGSVASDSDLPLADRLRQLFLRLSAVLREWEPAEAAVEETFVNKNPASTLKLGQARGVAMLAPSMAGMPVFEYPPNLIKKSIVGTGHAQKQQVALMVRTLLPRAGDVTGDAADALAVALCHAHHRQAEDRIRDALKGAAQHEVGA